MKTRAGFPLVLALLTAATQLGPVLAPVAAASDLRMTVEKPHFTCEGHGALLSHTAYVPGAEPRAADAKDADEAPLPCCDGQIGCAQFLSTNTILRGRHQLRT